jgi:hypothetical protein
VRKTLFALLVLAAIRLDADVTFAPVAPTSGDVITATIDILAVCDTEAETVVIGDVVRTTIHFTGCVPFPPFFHQTTAEFGPLPAGTYTYEVYFRFGDGAPELETRETLIVAAAPLGAAIPALDRFGTIAMIVLAGLAGVMCMRRFT